MQGASRDPRRAARRPPVRKLGALLLLVAAQLLLLAPPAFALPGDPPIENLFPQQFRAAPLLQGTIGVTYSCPAYRLAPGVPGGASDYGVRFTRGFARDADGRLSGDSAPSDYLSEAPAVPIPGTAACGSQLMLPSTPDPAALYFGPLAWQPYRSCPGCVKGWEVGEVNYMFVTPNAEGAELTIPKRVYAGYLTRFGFSSASDLSGTEIVLQWFGRRGWTDLTRAAYVPGGETALLAKLPAKAHRLRIEIAGKLWTQGLPAEEVTVIRPGRHRATGAGDDGVYAAGGKQLPAGFAVVADGRRLLDLEAGVPLVCQDPSQLPPGSAPIARIGSARVAPDGTVVARATSEDAIPVYTTLAGRLRHGRFAGTITAASQSCSGSREFRASLRSPGARAPR